MGTTRRHTILIATALLAGTLTLGACGEDPGDPPPAQEPAAVEQAPVVERAPAPHPSLVQEVPPADLLRTWPAEAPREAGGTAPRRVVTEPTDRLARYVQ
ncbi:MAG TPA: hypothetical protein VLO09_03370 [Ornithinimicrobium sp.]|nr:hypothetical protein [Ornithinimicrobium sp.]